MKKINSIDDLKNFREGDVFKVLAQNPDSGNKQYDAPLKVYFISFNNSILTYILPLTQSRINQYNAKIIDAKDNAVFVHKENVEPVRRELFDQYADLIINSKD
ncbi:MAG: hypothetical protein WC916_04320 [Candidatus Woesearchaeota archaeon]